MTTPQTEEVPGDGDKLVLGYDLNALVLPGPYSTCDHLLKGAYHSYCSGFPAGNDLKIGVSSGLVLSPPFGDSDLKFEG